jgi:predicted methyltransferase
MRKRFLILSCCCLVILSILVFWASGHSPWRLRSNGKLSSSDTFLIKERDIIYRPDAVARLLNIKPGSRIADIEPGNGYWTFKLAKAAGAGGYVYAVEAYRFWHWDWIPFLERQIEDRRVNPFQNVRLVRSPVDFIGLAPESLDLAFLCQTGLFVRLPADSLASNPQTEEKQQGVPLSREEMDRQKQLLRSIYDALKPGGRLAAIDLLESPMMPTLPSSPVKDFPGLINVAKNTQAVIRIYESAGFRLIHDDPIFRNEEHRNSIAIFKNLPVYKSIKVQMKCLFENEMFFLVFEKPLNSKP